MKSIIIANWKMNLSPGQETELTSAFKKELNSKKNQEVVICPSFLGLEKVAGILKGADLVLGAQDAFWEKAGAYTGQISPKFLKELGCEYAILGHSERRENLNETDEMVNKKVSACLENEMTPIICVGENFDQKQEGQTHFVVLHQLSQALKNIDLVEDEKLIIAYEPVWVIGRGQAVDPEEAEDVFEIIHQTLVDLYPSTIVKNNIRLIYGGSVDVDNAAGFMALDLCHGFLVGGASLDVERFAGVLNST